MADKWDFDLYDTGSCVYELDERGNVREVVAWAEEFDDCPEGFRCPL